MAGIEDRVNNWLKNPWTLAHRPFKVVDNVYFVGTSWVSAFLLNTQKGLVLIDCAMAGDAVSPGRFHSGTRFQSPSDQKATG